jgi:hypothetical protein
MAQLNDKFITFAYMRGEVDIPQNIPSAEFDHKISRAQERLRMLMGDEFYQAFLTAYKASTKQNPLTGAYAGLYDPYIKQFVAWQAYAYWTVEANYKPTIAGYRVHTEENSVAATMEEMAILIKDRKQQAEYYTKLLVDYMDNHAADLPLYQNNCRNLTGNTFHLTAVKKTHGDDCHCRRCRC